MVLLRLSCEETVLLARIKDARGTWIGLRDAHDKILPFIHLQSFKNNLASCGVLQRPALTLEKEFLFMSGAIKSRARLVSVLEVQSLCRCVRRLSFSMMAQAVAEIPDLPALNAEAGQGFGASGTSKCSRLMLFMLVCSNNNSSYMYVCARMMCSILNCFAPGQAKKLQLMPLQLPVNVVAAHDMNLHFSLSHKDREQQPLAGDIAAFKAWASEPIQLNRIGGCIVPRTLENITSHVYQYMGFLKLHLQKAQPSLLDFLDLQSYAAYISFQRAKGNVYNTVSQQLASARKMLEFLAIKGGVTATAAAAARNWLSRLNKQLATVLPLGSTTIDLCDLPSAHEIVQLIERFKCTTLGGLPPPGQPLSLETAKTLQQAALSCCIFGYLPPVRLVCLRTLQVPDSSKCLFGGCLKFGCKGNRLVWENKHLVMLLNHYKVERK